RPWLLAKAAEGGLEPAPASRLRGADPHQSNSCAPPQPFGRLLCSWHTIVGYPETGRARFRMGTTFPTMRYFVQVTEAQEAHALWTINQLVKTWRLHYSSPASRLAAYCVPGRAITVRM